MAPSWAELSRPFGRDFRSIYSTLKSKSRSHKDSLALSRDDCPPAASVTMNFPFPAHGFSS